MGLDDEPEAFDLMFEVERAKKHHDFDSFLCWYFEKYDGQLDETYEWADPEGDSLEDFKDFANWLVATGQGAWATYEENPDPIEIHESIPFPDNQLADSELNPNPFSWCGTDPKEDFHVMVGCVAQSGEWKQFLEHTMKGWEWWKSYVESDGIKIPFLDASLTLETSPKKFPLFVYSQRGDDAWTGEVGDLEKSKSDEGWNNDGPDDSWTNTADDAEYELPWDQNAGWDFQNEVDDDTQATLLYEPIASEQELADDDDDELVRDLAREFDKVIDQSPHPNSPSIQFMVFL